MIYMHPDSSTATFCVLHDVNGRPSYPESNTAAKTSCTPSELPRPRKGLLPSTWIMDQGIWILDFGTSTTKTKKFLKIKSIDGLITLLKRFININLESQKTS
jgi:hypothetical protein